MFCHDIIHPLHQIKAFKRDMSAAFLKITNAKEIILEDLLMWIIANKIHEPNGDIVPIIRDGFTIQQIQHTFQIG